MNDDGVIDDDEYAAGVDQGLVQPKQWLKVKGIICLCLRLLTFDF